MFQILQVVNSVVVSIIMKQLKESVFSGKIKFNMVWPKTIVRAQYRILGDFRKLR